jgi:hypothetical protein
VIRRLDRDLQSQQCRREPRRLAPHRQRGSNDEVALPATISPAAVSWWCSLRARTAESPAPGCTPTSAQRRGSTCAHRSRWSDADP